MADLDTTCPRCGAPFAKLLSVIYQEGLSTVETASESVGHTNTIGRVKIKTSGSTEGVAQTAASRAAAPPNVPKLIPKGESMQAVAGYGGAAIGGLIAFAMQSFLALIPAVLVGFVVGLFLAPNGQPTEAEREEHKRNTAKERQAYEDWKKTFRCNSCAHRFIPVENNKDKA